MPTKKTKTRDNLRQFQDSFISCCEAQQRNATTFRVHRPPVFYLLYRGIPNTSATRRLIVITVTKGRKGRRTRLLGRGRVRHSTASFLCAHRRPSRQTRRSYARLLSTTTTKAATTTGTGFLFGIGTLGLELGLRRCLHRLTSLLEILFVLEPTTATQLQFFNLRFQIRLQLNLLQIGQRESHGTLFVFQ